jgi:hypothetical protein
MENLDGSYSQKERGDSGRLAAKGVQGVSMMNSEKTQRILQSLDSTRDGSSIEKAVVIPAASEIEGVDKEYEWIARHYGPEDEAWNTIFQALHEKAGRQYDRLPLRLADGTKRNVCFDITDFYGN